MSASHWAEASRRGRVVATTAAGGREMHDADFIVMATGAA